MIHPGKLKAGDTVALLSPCSPQAAGNGPLIAQAIDLLKSWGLQVRDLTAVDRTHAYLAGTDTHRAQALQAAYTDPQIKALFFTRGGYGSARLLQHLDFAKLQPHRKIVVGYSDATTLLLLFQKLCDLVVYHGPNLAAPRMFGSVSSTRSQDSLHQQLFDRPCTQRHVLEKIRSGQISAELIGGNLTLLACSIGTQCEPDTAGKILFLEDTGKHPYQIDRLITHLRNAGKLRHIAGVIFSDMAGCHGRDGPLWDTIDDLFHDALYPVAYGLPSGHGDFCATLPLGERIILDADRGEVVFGET